jgi:PAS domain S-box-containing protein
MTDANSRRALALSILVAAILLATDVIIDTAMLRPRYGHDPLFTRLVLVDVALALAAVALIFWLLRRQLTARAAAEAERAAAEARMFDLVNVAPVAIIGSDDQFRVTSWNPAAEKLYGWMREEVLGKHVSSIVRSETTPQQIASAEAAVRERGEYVSEWVHLNRAGERLIVLGDTITLRNAQGDVMGYVSVNRDVTASRSMEQALQESEQRLQLILDNTPSGISYVDKGHKYVFASRGYERLMGLRPEDLVGQYVWDVMPPVTQERGRPALEAALRGESVVFENVLPKAGGGVFPALVNFVPHRVELPDGSSEVAGVFVSVTDITRVSEAEAALVREHALVKRQRQEWQLLFENLTVGASIEDAQGRIVTANKRLLEMHDASSIEELSDLERAAASFEVMRPDGSPAPLSEWPTAIALSGQAAAAEHIVAHRGTGKTASLRYSAVPQFDEQGHVAQVFTTVEDLTDLRLAEEAALARSRELEAVLENVTAGVMMMDRNGALIAVNDRILEQHGFTRANAPTNARDFGNNFRVTLPDGREPTRADFPALKALAGERSSGEFVLAPLTGGESWIARYIATPIMDAAGEVDRVVLTVLDVTEPRRAALAIAEREAVIRQQLAEIESIYNTAPIGLCVFDTELRYLRINQRLAEINGLSAEEHIGKTPRDIVPTLGDAAEAALRTILETGEPVLDVEFRAKLPSTGDQERVWIEQWVPFIDANGKVLGIHVVVEDVTERRRVEAELRESQELMRRALEVGRSFAFQFRMRSDEVMRSAESAVVLGLPEAESMQDTGPGYFQRVHPDDRPRYVARMLGLTPENDTYRTTYRIVQPRGSVLYVEESARGVFDEEGTLIQVFGITQDVTDRVRAEQERERLLAQVQAQRARAEELAAELQAERDTLSTIMENTRTQLAYLDTDMRFLNVNTAYAAGADKTRAELIGQRHFELFPNDENEAIFNHVLASGLQIEYNAKPFEYPGAPELGSTYWDWTLVPVKNPAGQVQGLVLSLTDVTEQKRAEEVLRNARDELEVAVADATAELRAAVAMLEAEIGERERAEEALRESEARLRVLVEQMPAILWTTDRDLVYTSHEGAGLRGLDLRPGEMVGQSVGLSETPGAETEQDIVIAAHRHALEGDSVTYVTVWNDAHVEGYIEPFRDASGEIVGCIGVAMDVTQRVEAERAQREREEQYRRIFEATSDAMLIVSLRGQIVDANPAASKMSGYAYEEFLQLSPTAFVREDQRDAIERVFEAVRAGRRLERQAVGLRKNGSQFDLELRAGQFQYGGEPHILAVVRDVTERVRAYQLLEQRVRERTRELMSLLAFSRQASATLEVRPLMQLAVDEVARLVDNSGVSLLMLEGETLKMVAHRGRLPVTMAEQVRLTVNDPNIRALLLNDPAPIVLPDLDAESQEAEAIRRVGSELLATGDRLRSIMWVPLIVKGKLVGGLGVGHREPNQYTDREAGLVQAMANQAAVAIENARLYEQAHELAVMHERQRLARELHDSVTQSLYSLSLMAEAARRLVTSGNMDRGMGYLVRIGESAQQVLKEMRLLVYELRPLMLERDGLASALKQRLETVEGRAGVETKLVVEGSGLLPEHIETELYRIAQEALNNSLKHSNASAVAVHLDTSSDVIKLKVQDNGRGFATEEIADKGGLGLVSIQERSQRLGGEATIESAPGQGVTIAVRIPVSGNTQK